MKIGIIAFPYDRGRSGIWNYIKNLITEIVALDRDNEYYIFTSHNFNLNQNNVTQVLFGSKWINNPIINILWHQLYLPYAANRFKLDILHLPAGNRRMILFKNCKIVTTVHDLSQFHVANKYGILRMIYTNKILPLIANHLNKIISISESTKKDILRYWKAKDKDIVILPNGIDRDFLIKIKGMDGKKAERVLEKYKINGDFIFYVSRLEHPGKNHVGFIKAYDRLRQETGLPHKLVLAGSGWSRTDAIFNEAKRSRFSSDIIFTDYIPEDEMPYLYTAAKLFAFPSLYEGFGIPLLEAMACGTPIICSNVSSMPEVLDDCGLLFDPKDPEDMAGKMKMMLTDPGLRAQCVKKGLERVKAFNWEDVAGRTVQIYKDICNG